jgi:hypothetical protein
VGILVNQRRIECWTGPPLCDAYDAVIISPIRCRALISAPGSQKGVVLGIGVTVGSTCDLVSAWYVGDAAADLAAVIARDMVARGVRTTQIMLLSKPPHDWKVHVCAEIPYFVSEDLVGPLGLGPTDRAIERRVTGRILKRLRVPTSVGFAPGDELYTPATPAALYLGTAALVLSGLERHLRHVVRHRGPFPNLAELCDHIDRSPRLLAPSVATCRSQSRLRNHASPQWTEIEYPLPQRSSDPIVGCPRRGRS